MKLEEVGHKALAFTDDIFLLKKIKRHIARCECCREELAQKDNHDEI